MSLNICLTAFLIQNVLAQTSNDKLKDQPPIVAEVVGQKDCPLRIMVVNVDNSSLTHQEIIYSLQNVSNKSIRAYTLLGDDKSSGKIMTSFFVAKLFQASGSITNSLPVERLNIKEGETIFLSIDYIEFEDGRSWGKDTVGKSEEIAGERDGVKAAIKQLKDLIKNQNANSAVSVTNFLKQDIQEIPVGVPKINQSDEWKKAFRIGYKTVISILQDMSEQGSENLTKKLDELEKNIN